MNEISQAEKAQQDMNKAQFALTQSLKNILKVLGGSHPDGDFAEELLIYLGKSSTNITLIRHDIQNGFFLCTKDLPEVIRDRFSAVLKPEFNKEMIILGFVQNNEFFTR